MAIGPLLENWPSAICNKNPLQKQFRFCGKDGKTAVEDAYLHEI